MASRRPTAVVTGASSGIGAAIADKLLSMGWDVCLIARRENEMRKITKKYDPSQSLIISCDLTDEILTINACQQIIAWCQNKKTGQNYLNLLINNAGFLDIKNEIESKSEKDILVSLKSWNAHIAVLLKAPVIFTKYFVNLLKNAAADPLQYDDGIYDGSIINISSIASFNLVSPPISPYCSCKAALNMLTKLTAKELSAKYKIRCNAIKFGSMDTHIPYKGGWSKDGWHGLVSVNPMGRIGNMNDCNQIMLFLADKNKSGYINGTAINVDGGYGAVGCTGNDYAPKRLNSLL